MTGKIFNGVYLGKPELTILELLEDELKVFEVSCEQAIFYGTPILYVSDIFPKLKSMSISEKEILNHLDELSTHGYIDKKLTLIGDKKFLFVFSINHFAIEQYLKKHLMNYEYLLNRINSFIESSKANNLESEIISEQLKLPKLIVNHLLEKLQMMGYIKITKRIRGNWLINKDFKCFI